MDGDTTLGAMGLSAGSATYKTSKLAIGSHTITAVYDGSSVYSNSTSPNLVQTVNQDSTTTAVTASVNPSVFGQSVTFTTTVTAAAPGSGTPTGSVTLMDGSITLGTAHLSGGRATIKTSSLAVGSQSITVFYSGDGNFTSSTSAALTQTVNQDATTISLKSSANPSIFGQSVTFTATVKAAAPGSGTPSGTVTFYDGIRAIGTGTLGLGNPDTATFKTSSLSVGAHAITAQYAGDGNFTTITSAPLTQTVNQAATKMTVASSVNPSNPLQVAFTATVAALAPGSGVPTGTVTFFINGTPQPAVQLMVENGVDEATFTYTFSIAGTYTITAVYSGYTDFTTSTSSVLHKKVK